jgi:hypothetical protein
MRERKNPYHGGNDPFVCAKCGLEVVPLAGGGQRNHCPRCLYSMHVDGSVPGDRASGCDGLMCPIAVERSGKKGWIVVLLRLAEVGPSARLRRAYDRRRER